MSARYRADRASPAFAQYNLCKPGGPRSLMVEGLTSMRSAGFDNAAGGASPADPVRGTDFQ